MSKARKANRAKKREARAKKKETRFNKRMDRKDRKADAQIERKGKRLDLGRKGRKSKETDAEQARLDKQQETDANIQEKTADADIALQDKQVTSKMMQEEAETISRLSNVQEKEENLPEGAMPSPDQQIRMRNYLQTRGTVGVYKDPSLMSAQIMEQRQEEIARRRQAEIDEEMQEDPWTALEDRDFPDEEDIEEEWIDEEYDSFAFSGETKADFLDEDTLALVYKVGKAASDKYREKRFKQGKKAFGMDQKTFEAKQAANGDRIIDAASDAAEKEIKKQKIKEYTPAIVAGVAILIVIVVAAFVYGKKKS